MQFIYFRISSQFFDKARMLCFLLFNIPSRDIYPLWLQLSRNIFFMNFTLLYLSILAEVLSNPQKYDFNSGDLTTLYLLYYVDTIISYLGRVKF